MATYTKVPRTMPSAERNSLITEVVAGDQIDLVDILGRPARGLKIVTAATTDVIEYRLNSLKKLPTLRDSRDVLPNRYVEVWSGGEGAPVYTATGDTVYDTITDLQVSSIEILSSTATLTITVW